VSLLLAVLLVVGCDSSGGLDDDGNTTVSAEETAESIAVSLAKNTGGTTDDLADAAETAEGNFGSNTAKALSRTKSCDFDDADERWTCTIEVDGTEVGARIDSLQRDRRFRAQFFADGAAVMRPVNADSMTFEIVQGSGRVLTDRLDTRYTLQPSTWALGSLDGDGEYTVSLLSDESGRDVTETFTGAVRQRTRDATVRKTQVDGLVMRNGLPVAGTIEGSYEAQVEIQRADGSTVDRSVNVTFRATFAEEGAEITFTGGGERFNGETFAFDVASGELESSG
jgi:hypothetical protein